MSPRKSVENELTREMILDEARDLFIEEGYQKVSMRKIANRLGYSHGSLYYHFKNKAELFSTLIKEDFHKLDTILYSILEKKNVSNEEKLLDIFSSYIEFGLTYRKQYELMFLYHDDEMTHCLEQSPYQSYCHYAEAIKRLTSENISIHLIWSSFLSLHGFVTHYLHSNQTYQEIEPLAKEHGKFLLKGLT